MLTLTANRVFLCPSLWKRCICVIVYTVVKSYTPDTVICGKWICSRATGDKWTFRHYHCCLMLQCKTLFFLYSRRFLSLLLYKHSAFILVQLCLQLMLIKYCKEPMTSACTIKCFLTYKIFWCYKKTIFVLTGLNIIWFPRLFLKHKVPKETIFIQLDLNE